MQKKGTFIVVVFILVVGLTWGEPTEETIAVKSDKDKLGEEIEAAVVDGQNGLQQTTEPQASEKEGFSRFLLTQVGTMLCYRTWEVSKAIDFHECNVCFNDTQLPESSLPKDDHIVRVESCFNKYLGGTEYNECLPMLRDPTIPNKPYDILVSEPPFEFSYRNFARCAHGIVFRQEGQKCVQPTDVVQGVEPFLEKFSCLLKNLIVESRRFSEANLEELLGSVPFTNGTTDGTTNE